jgi:hypothetical protein
MLKEGEKHEIMVYQAIFCQDRRTGKSNSDGIGHKKKRRSFFSLTA